MNGIGFWFFLPTAVGPGEKIDGKIGESENLYDCDSLSESYAELGNCTTQIKIR